eukprot:Skav229459  [mRNA]  locus=scaffold577:112058:115862:+ [translate_table: standard]
MGTASCNWVRPIFTTSANSSAFLKKLLLKFLIAFNSSECIRIHANFAEVGYESLVDCPLFTSSLGLQNSYCPFSCPKSSRARLAMTSLAFMLVDVPAPP